ncbi:hypothetical protein RU639_005018 [Aspergillus parasiticus]
MSPEPECTSHTTLPPFTYPTLPQELYTTRMIRLLPHEDKSAPIQCELFNYDLSETGDGMHLYQALSYVWGSEMKPESIILNGCIFHVTANLHAALSHLRNRQFEKILWVDAICINQDEEDQGNEKSKQIPLMRTIYAQAERVIVWLGDATENGDKALEVIRCLAEEQDTSSTLNTSENYDACLCLLQRDWFSRIWVLQEVGVARCVSIMCGSVYINGHIFCEGLSILRRFLDLPSTIGPVTYLIRGALYRPKYELGSRGSISMGELIGMYHDHKATKQHDKVYALLGLSADPITAALEPNYSLPWKEVFKQTINYMFPECSVEAFIETETAVMKSEGWILGVITSVEENTSRVGKQIIEVIFNYTAKSLGYKYEWDTRWELEAFAALIQEGDIICLLKGASNPSIIRLCKDHFAIITPAVTPRQRQYKRSLTVKPQGRNSGSGLFDILLTWKTPLATTQSKDKPETMFPLMKTPPNLQEERFEAQKRLKHTTLVVIDIALRILTERISSTRVIAHLLRQSGTEDPIIEEFVKLLEYKERPSTMQHPSDLLRKHGNYLLISEETVIGDQGNDLLISEETVIGATTDAGPYGCIIMELLLQYQGASLPVSKEVVKAAAGNEKDYGYIILVVLFLHRGENLPVSEEVVRAATGNIGSGHGTLKTLFQHRGENLPVSEEVVKAAVGNIGSYGPEILEVLFQHRGENLPVSEEVVMAAAGNNGSYGPKILEVLFQHRGENLPVSKEVVKAAAGNNGPYGPEILVVLFQHRGENLPVSEEVVMAAAGNNGSYGRKILEVLFQHRGENLPVSKEVVKAAAGNNGYHGHEILQFLFQQDKNLPVSEEVVRTAAENSGLYVPEILKVLFQQDKNLPVSEEVVRAAAGNNGYYGPEILHILFLYRGENLPVSEEVVKAAAGNIGSGHGTLKTLFQHRGENLPVSEEVVRAAAGNNGYYGPEILEILVQQQGENLPITEEVVKAAAGNDGHGHEILEILFQQGKNLTVSEEVASFANLANSSTRPIKQLTMKFAVFIASSILTISFAQEKATFTLYGEGDTRGSPNCATNVNACGQPNLSGNKPILRNVLGDHDHFGPEWKTRRGEDYQGYREQSLYQDGNPICNTPNKYDAGIHFDLYMDTGAGIRTARQASC